MSTPQSTAIETNGSIVLDSDLNSDANTTELVEAVTSMADEIADLRETVEEQQDTIDDLKDQLRAERETRGEQDAEIRGRLTEVEERVEDIEEHGSSDADPTPEAAQTDSLTPIERLSDGDRDDVAQHVTPSIERAVTLFEHLTDWGSRTPQGHTLRPADSPKQLLEAVTGESLAWQQYYRAAEALEQLSRGAVTFFDHRKHGRTLVLHDDTAVHDRLTDTTPGRSQSSLVAD